MTVVTEPFTAEALLDLPDDGQRYELIAGELVAMPPTGYEHGSITGMITGSLQPFVFSNNLGTVCVGETGFLLALSPDTVRASDIAFIAGGESDEEGWVQGCRRGAPDLVFAIVSPSDRYTDVEDKVAVWFEGGARMVVVVNPRRQTVAVYRGPTTVRMLTIDDSLECEDIVPGWQMPVAMIFRRTRRLKIIVKPHLPGRAGVRRGCGRSRRSSAIC